MYKIKCLYGFYSQALGDKKFDELLEEFRRSILPMKLKVKP